MKVVHCKKDKFNVYIGRPSKWGNPFTIGKDGSREEVIRKYEKYLLNCPDLLNSLEELKGKTLGCWCSPQACHGDILLKYANHPNISKVQNFDTMECPLCGSDNISEGETYTDINNELCDYAHICLECSYTWFEEEKE